MENRRKRFENIFRCIKNSKDFSKMSLEEIGWKLYNQACVDCGEDSFDISIEETQKMVEDEMFFDFISECLLYPQDNKPIPGNDYVKVKFCEPDKCVGFPDRIDEMDCEHCEKIKIINLSKLCGVESTEEKINDKILTSNEIKELTKILTKD